ncbi:MAG: ABC transporter permease [Proteobacteria bacterium]|nr:MAG: ABC transporter permease [Pseudomonadota bacterium]
MVDRHRWPPLRVFLAAGESQAHPRHRRRGEEGPSLVLRFLARRCLELIPVLWGVGTLVFFLLHLVPGDPVEIMLGENSLPASRTALRSSLGLDRPILTQYFHFWGGLAKGDLGESLISRKPVASLILERLPATASLTAAALLWALLISLPLGILAAAFRRSALDKAVLLYSILGVSMPSFWIGPLLMLFFAVHLGWLPVSEREGWSSYILPSLTLGLSLSAILARMTRATMVESLSQEYIVTARAKGLGWAAVNLKHALKNAVIPVITLLGLQLGGLLAGAVITETIFDWPGLGELIFRGIQSRDYPLVQGCVLVIATTYVLANTLADIAYTLANPRIELK